MSVPKRRRHFPSAQQYDAAVQAEARAADVLGAHPGQSVDDIPDEAFGEPPLTPAPPNRPGKLSYHDIFLCLQLETAGKSQREIAAIMHVSQQAISNVLAEFRDSRLVARRRLDAAADRLARAALVAAETAATTGDADTALELLDRLDVAPKRSQAADSGPKVVVVVGQADPRALPPLTAAGPTSA